MAKKKKKRANRPHDAPVSKRNKKADFIICSIFFIGLALTYWEVILFRTTIIPLAIPLALCFVPGIILTPLCYHKLNEIDGRRGHWILHYILHSFTTGAILLFTFMSVNYYLVGEEIIVYKFDIQSKSSISGPRGHRHEREPTVMINYFGFEKE